MNTPPPLGLQLPSAPRPGVRVIALDASHEALLQAFFDANPAYFLAVTGEPAGPTEAREEIHSRPPPDWPYSRTWLIGYLDEASGELLALADGVSDLLAPGVWHIGLFIVATARHGSGDAQRLHQGLRDWAAAQGAAWLRLGVVQGNARAERFWQAQGYRQTRLRQEVQIGPRTHTVRVMVLPLAGGDIADYLARVPRDRPESA